MKKLSILLSMLMIVGMFGTVASALTTTAKVTLDVDATTVEVGDIVTVTVGLEGDPTLPANGTLKAVATWDAECFEFVAGSAEATSATFNLTQAPTASLASAGTYVTFTQKLSTDENKNIILDGEYVFGTFQVKALKEADAASISIHANTAVKFGATADTAFADETATVAIAITAAGPVGPTTVTTDATKVDNAVAEEGETYIENSDAAVAYWAEGDFTQGKSSAYWTATINGDNKKKDVAVPNITGKAKLGIVIVGATSVEAVKLNVVTQ